MGVETLQLTFHLLMTKVIKFFHEVQVFVNDRSALLCFGKHHEEKNAVNKPIQKV